MGTVDDPAASRVQYGSLPRLAYWTCRTKRGTSRDGLVPERGKRAQAEGRGEARCSVGTCGQVAAPWRPHSLVECPASGGSGARTEASQARRSTSPALQHGVSNVVLSWSATALPPKQSMQGLQGHTLVSLAKTSWQKKIERGRGRERALRAEKLPSLFSCSCLPKSVCCIFGAPHASSHSSTASVSKPIY